MKAASELSLLSLLLEVKVINAIRYASHSAQPQQQVRNSDIGFCSQGQLSLLVPEETIRWKKNCVFIAHCNGMRCKSCVCYLR